jgi:Guanylate-binding protein, N-terminal domain
MLKEKQPYKISNCASPARSHTPDAYPPTNTHTRIHPLQETRDQITACFEKVTCFGLCHPGMDVVRKNFDGAIDRIDPTFRLLLDAYVRRVFGPDLEPKVTVVY